MAQFSLKKKLYKSTRVIIKGFGMGISVVKPESKVDFEPKQKQNMQLVTSSKDESIFSKVFDFKSFGTAETLMFAVGVAAGVATGGIMFKFLKAGKFSGLKNLFSSKTRGMTISPRKITELNLPLEHRDKLKVALSEMRAAKASKVSATSVDDVAKSAQKEADKFYDDIIAEFDKIHPGKREVFIYTNSDTVMKDHISGAKSEFTTNLDNRLKAIGFSHKYVNGDKKLFLSSYNGVSGDEIWVAQYKKFLNGASPTEANFKEFIRLKEIEYLKENPVACLTDFKVLKASQDKGKQIAELEKSYHDMRQKMYRGLWRGYPTDQFYRLVGKDELMALLKGKNIASPRYNSYGWQITDITTNKYYGNIGMQGKFLIPFKRTNADGTWRTSLTSRISVWAPENQHYHLGGSYNLDDVDVEKIMFWGNSDWVPLKELL